MKKDSTFTIGEQFFVHLVLKQQTILATLESISQPYLQTLLSPPIITYIVSSLCSSLSGVLTPLIGKTGNFLASAV